MTYEIINKYGVNIGETRKFRKPMRALKALNKYRGSGWIVVDNNYDQIGYGDSEKTFAVYVETGVAIK